VRGKYHAFKSGHELNNKLCLALLAKPAAWRYAT
jgi:UDP-3-O-acyl-N-acetylglucosamine deacetylase